MAKWYARYKRCVANRRTRSAGFTLVELLSVLTLVAILTTIALSSSTRIASSRRVQQATSDVLEMQSLIDDYILENDELPATLAAAGAGSFVDPWGQAYQYNPFTTSDAVAAARKDRFLHPLNTYYDLYSVGPDGATSASIMNDKSLDDIIRANDGAFVGRASAY